MSSLNKKFHESLRGSENNLEIVHKFINDWDYEENSDVNKTFASTNVEFEHSTHSHYF